MTADYCTCHEFQVIKAYSLPNNSYIFSLHRNPDLDDSIYNCVLSSINDIQELNRKSSFIFAGDLNAHHQECFKSMSPTDRYGITAFNFTNLSGCTQLFKELTHKLDKFLNLLLTDVPGEVHPLIDPPLGNSFSFSVKMGFKILNITFSQKLHLKLRVNWPLVDEDLRNFNCSVIKIA